MFLLSAFFLNAQQQIVVSGTISDSETGEAIANVIVTLDKTFISQSNSSGYYKLLVTEKEIKNEAELKLNLVGYEALSIIFYKSNGADQIINLSLKKSNTILDQVVVTAGRREESIKTATVSTEIIKPYLIENRVVTNMDKLIDQAPGLNVVDGQANIRGGSGWSYGTGSRVLVLLDDMPFISGDAGQVLWKFLPIENVAQVEIIKGASSVLYGSSAMNGIINFKTIQPGKKPITNINVFSGIYDKPERTSLRWTNSILKQVGFNIFHTKKINNNDFGVTLFYIKDDGYRLGESDNRLRSNFNTKFRNKKINGLQYGLNGGVMYSRSNSFLLWEDFKNGYTVLDSQTTKTNSGNFYLDPYLQYYKNGLKHNIRTRWMHVFNSIDNPDTTYNQDNSFYFFYGDYQIQKNIVEFKTTITLGATGQYTESNSPLFQGFNTNSNAAAYLQIDKKFGKRLNTSTGIRYERYSINKVIESKPVFRFGLNLELTKSTFLRTSFGQGFRFPAMAEKFIKTSVGLLNIFANENLKSESGFNAELGIKQGFKINKFYGFIDAAYFHTEYQNMMEFNFAFWGKSGNLANDMGFKSVNVADTRISGVDIALGTEGEIGKIKTQIIAGYTYMVPVSITPNTVTAVDGFNQNITYLGSSSDTTSDFVLKYRYRHIAKMDLQLSYNKFSYGISFRYNSYMENVDKIFVMDLVPGFPLFPGMREARNMNKNGDWIWDTRFSYALSEKYKINFVVNNLFNHEMMTRPADLRAPRMFMVQMQMKF